jgi:hypothetical protein
MVGVSSIEIPAMAEVERSGKNLEVALILDTTGSMKGSRIEGLKAAANDFVRTVVWDNQNLLYSKVAVIPYSMGVNVGALAATVHGTVRSGTCTSPGCIGFDIENLDVVRQTLSSCATGSANAYLAASQSQLADVFALIGKRVTGLRLAR